MSYEVCQRKQAPLLRAGGDFERRMEQKGDLRRNYAVGIVCNEQGKATDTRCFKIHYGDNEVHAVPRFDDGRIPDEV